MSHRASYRTAEERGRVMTHATLHRATGRPRGSHARARWSRVGLIVLLAIPVATRMVPAQNRAPAKPQDEESDLSKKTQNPVGDLVSVPLQYNFFTGGGLGGRTLSNLNFQPVFPL